jgi:hypothetical protein
MQVASESTESKLLKYLTERLKYLRLSTLGNRCMLSVEQECTMYSSLCSYEDTEL